MKRRKAIRDIFAHWDREAELVTSNVTEIELVTPGDTSDINVFFTYSSVDYYMSFESDRHTV